MGGSGCYHPDDNGGNYGAAHGDAATRMVRVRRKLVMVKVVVMKKVMVKMVMVKMVMVRVIMVMMMKLRMKVMVRIMMKMVMVKVVMMMNVRMKVMVRTMMKVMMKMVVMKVRMVIMLMNGQSEMPSDRDLFSLTFCHCSPGLLLLRKTMVIPGWSPSIPRLKKHPSTISDSTGV